MSDRAFQEGKLAAARGLPASAVPYKEDDEEHGWWITGHEHASESDDDGETDPDG